jgi:hypothetical protein
LPKVLKDEVVDILVQVYSFLQKIWRVLGCCF